MEFTHLVRNFLKLQKALENLEKDGIPLGSLRSKGLNSIKEVHCDDYSDTELLIAGSVKELFKRFSENNVFCCGAPKSTLAEAITNLYLKTVIEKSKIAGFGVLKEGANVVDYSIRKAWEAFFHLDFDCMHILEIRPYVPGLSVETLVRLRFGNKHQLNLLMGRATIENVSQGSFVQQSRDEDSEESEENDSEESEQYYTATFEAKVTDGDAFLTTTVTATNIVEPDSARASFDHWTSTRFSYECQCGAQATEANAKWCRHAVATVLEMVDPFTEKERPDYAYYKAIFLRPIMEHIQKHMAHGAPISVLPYNINVYGEGGFFKRHVDSPRDADNMVGTLVVCLPSKHEGGELVVSHGGVEHAFDFAPLSGDRQTIQWAAMYGDCLHEVKEVRSGYRATLTFSIIQEEEKGTLAWNAEPRRGPRDNLPESGYKITYDDGFHEYPAVEETFTGGPWNKSGAERKAQAVVEALGALDPTTEYVTILLSHDYTQANLVRPEMLKGTDWALYQALSQAYSVDMLTVVLRDRWTLPYECDEPEQFAGGEGTSVCSCYAFSKEDLAWLAGEGPKPKYKWEAAARAGKVLFVAPRPGQKALLDSKESGYHGNQFDEGGEILSVYFEAALVVHVKNKKEEKSRSGGRLRSLA